MHFLSRVLARCGASGPAVMLVMGIAVSARAQNGTGTQGALDLVLPIGARTLGMGQAAAANAEGSDALWWNPALIARAPREAALQITQTLSTQTGTDAALAFIYTLPRVGAVGLSLRYLNYGQQEATDLNGNLVGHFAETGTIFAATFAAPFGDRLALGLTAKLLRVGFPCTGDCSFTVGSSTSPQTGALDLGAQYIATSDSLITLGFAIRNAGFKLQTNDTPQADEIPGRVQFGIAAAPKFAELPPEVRLRGALDVVRSFGSSSTGVSVGAELSYRNVYHLRGGYAQNGPTGSGPTFGVGVSTGKLRLDFARMITDIGTQSGVTPTYIALRYMY